MQRGTPEPWRRSWFDSREGSQMKIGDKRIQMYGDQYYLDCPACNKGGLNDLWDGRLDFAGLEGETDCECSYCGSISHVEVTCSVTAVATLKERKTNAETI